ncbi:MAG: RnfABCDGE type electron transport complex subunit G, partial [Bacteroidales bacterium]|nr:RnfABCDGE type electron transport complex subunit G [Bacteroidales bacterium]
MAAKKESSFFNMVSSLLVISAVSALSLGTVFNLTKEPIALARKAKQEAAIKAVLPAFDELKTIKVKSALETDSLEFNQAYVNGSLVGTAINTFTNKGFGGNIKLMVGLLPDGTINNISVLEHKETPGLGDKMQKNKSAWSEQFNGLKTDKLKKLDVTK